MVVQDHLPIFAANGFEFAIDEMGPAGNRVRLTAKPSSKDTEFGVQGASQRGDAVVVPDRPPVRVDVHEMIALLRHSPGKMCRPSRITAMFASRACRKSVMIGSALSTQEMTRVRDCTSVWFAGEL